MSIEDEPKKQIKIELGIQGAEAILIALAQRAGQKGMPKAQKEEIIRLGRSLSTSFEKELGADPKWFDRWMENTKRLTITVKVVKA